MRYLPIMLLLLSPCLASAAPQGPRPPQAPDTAARTAWAWAVSLPRTTTPKPPCACGERCPVSSCPGGAGCTCAAAEASPCGYENCKCGCKPGAPWSCPCRRASAPVTAPAPVTYRVLPAPVYQPLPAYQVVPAPAYVPAPVYQPAPSFAPVPSFAPAPVSFTRPAPAWSPSFGGGAAYAAPRAVMMPSFGGGGANCGPRG